MANKAPTLYTLGIWDEQFLIYWSSKHYMLDQAILLPKPIYLNQQAQAWIRFDYMKAQALEDWHK